MCSTGHTFSFFLASYLLNIDVVQRNKMCLRVYFPNTKTFYIQIIFFFVLHTQNCSVKRCIQSLHNCTRCHVWFFSCSCSGRCHNYLFLLMQLCRCFHIAASQTVHHHTLLFMGPVQEFDQQSLSQINGCIYVFRNARIVLHQTFCTNTELPRQQKNGQVQSNKMHWTKSDLFSSLINMLHLHICIFSHLSFSFSCIYLCIFVQQRAPIVVSL